MSKHRKAFFTSWSMPDPAKNYVPLPKGIYRIGLSGEEIAIYGYLFSLENESYQCWPSYETIGEAVHMSKRTVMKYVAMLEEKHLICTERTEVIRKDGMKYNGTLRYGAYALPRSAAYLCDDGTAKRRRHPHGLGNAGTRRSGLHAAHLHAHESENAGGSRGNGGASHGTEYLKICLTISTVL